MRTKSATKLPEVMILYVTGNPLFTFTLQLLFWEARSN